MYLNCWSKFKTIMIAIRTLKIKIMQKSDVFYFLAYI